MLASSAAEVFSPVVPDHTMPRGPRQVPAGTLQPGRVYVLADEYYAEHRRPRGTPAPGAALVLEGGQIAVFARAERPIAGTAGAADVGPVYAAPDGVLAVPTGLLFVRFAEGTPAASKRQELERAGVEVTEIPRYAPHAAWVRAREGGIAASLGQVAAVEAIPGVQNVEPQMLMESVRR